MLLGALETIEAINAAQSEEAITGAVAAHGERLGARYLRVVQVRGADGVCEANAIVDTAPDALSFAALRQRHPQLVDTARRFVGKDGVVRDTALGAADLCAIGAEHARAGAATIVGAPLSAHGENAGYGVYFFAEPPKERDALNRVVRFVCQAALHRFAQLNGDEDEALISSLTPRQSEVLTLVSHGKSDGEIAAALGLSQSTVHEYIEEAKRRIGVRTRVQAAVIAARNGWVAP